MSKFYKLLSKKYKKTWEWQYLKNISQINCCLKGEPTMHTWNSNDLLHLERMIISVQYTNVTFFKWNMDKVTQNINFALSLSHKQDFLKSNWLYQTCTKTRFCLNPPPVWRSVPTKDISSFAKLNLNGVPDSKKAKIQSSRALLEKSWFNL